MKYYGIAEIDATDLSWVEEYLAGVTPLVERLGGRYLARNRPRKIEGGGPPPQTIVLIEWPSEEAALAFYDSDEYRPYREARLAGASGDLLLVPGADFANLAAIDD
jgi:uncharacterized protein (DUF1330 family)